MNKPQKQLLSNAVCWGRCYSCCCCFFSRSFLSSVYRKQWQLSHRGDAKHNRGAKETRAWFCAAGLCYICKVRDEGGCKNRKCTFLSFLIPIHPSLSIIRREANGTRFLMGKGGKQNQKNTKHIFHSFIFFLLFFSLSKRNCLFKPNAVSVIRERQIQERQRNPRPQQTNNKPTSANQKGKKKERMR